MAEFPELKDALLAWVKDAVERLPPADSARDVTTDLGRWQRDADGVFRFAERVIEVWDRAATDKLFELPSWAAVLEALCGDDRLRSQVDTFIGTPQGGQHVPVTHFGQLVLPRPNEVGKLAETFEVRYAELEDFLATDEITYTAIWPLPGLSSDVLPIQLDAALELAAMSDRELGYALYTEIVRPRFPGQRLFIPEPELLSCARYRYRLPKLVGEIDVNQTLPVFQQAEDELQQIESALKESLSIVLPDAVGIAGRFVIVSQAESPLAGGVGFQQATLPQGSRLRRAHMTDDQAAELAQMWTWVRQPQLLQRHKGLALALRRLSYQAQRDRPEDELLDTMIAAEALYLTDMGDAAERGELRFRLALRAALWVNPEHVGFTRREVLGVMKSAYDARSAIAHGGSPDARDIKVRGQRVTLQELAEAAKSVVISGCRSALERAASGAGWPPDWDGMALGDVS